MKVGASNLDRRLFVHLTNRVYQHVVFLVSCSLPFLRRVDWKQSRNVRKKTIFRSLKNCFSARKIVFPQSFSFLQVIVESNVSGPQVHPNIDFAWIGSSPEMCEKTIFRSLIFSSAKPQFSSSYCGKQCFRSPSLPKYCLLPCIMLISILDMN